MSRVLSWNTKPEVAVRKALRAAGYRFSTRAGERLPGKPDLIFPALRFAVFVNGCLWHWHGCKRSRMPKTNRKYWERKITRNMRRDRRSKMALNSAGWHYWTVWECNLKIGTARLLARIKTLECKAG